MAIFRVGILIVSTSAAGGESEDLTTAALTNLFDSANTQSEAASWKIVKTKTVPDDPHRIKDAILEWTDGPKEETLNLVVTSGGTGFAVTDSTPETVKGLLQKEASGLVHAMLSASLAITPFAMMSRPVAGVRNSSIIITLPGSPKGAKENLQTVIKTLPHALTQAANLQPSRKIHAGGTEKLEIAHGIHQPESRAQREESFTPSDAPSPELVDNDHHHHHHHHSHDHSHEHGQSHKHSSHSHDHSGPKRHETTPRANQLGEAVTQRHRESPYPMLSVKEAHDLVAEHTPLTEITTAPVNSDLVGYVLAQDVVAPEAVPAFRASIVDGYAVIHTDGPGVYPVVSISHAAPGSVPKLEHGQIARITTGAPLPPGATAVVMVEETSLKSKTNDGQEEKEVEIHAKNVEKNDNVREAGSDVQKGSVILAKGTVISANGGEVGLLASVGLYTVKVYRKFKVGVLSTGDELVNHTEPRKLNYGEIRDSNRPALLTAIKSCGFPAVDLGIAADKPGSLEKVLKEALEGVDVVITTGGVSMGELDLLKPTIEQSLHGTIHFGRVAMKPGKPTTFATTPEKKLIFALPGNPASALVTFHLFVLPSLRKAAGYGNNSHLPLVRVIAGEDFKLDPRPEYHRVHIKMQRDGKLVAYSTGGQRSSRIGSAARANGMLALPSKKDVGEKRGAYGAIPQGEPVTAMLWGQIGGLD